MLENGLGSWFFKICWVKNAKCDSDFYSNTTYIFNLIFNWWLEKKSILTRCSPQPVQSRLFGTKSGKLKNICNFIHYWYGNGGGWELPDGTCRVVPKSAGLGLFLLAWWQDEGSDMDEVRCCLCGAGRVMPMAPLFLFSLPHCYL